MLLVTILCHDIIEQLVKKTKVYRLRCHLYFNPRYNSIASAKKSDGTCTETILQAYSNLGRLMHASTLAGNKFDSFFHSTIISKPRGACDVEDCPFPRDVAC